MENFSLSQHRCLKWLCSDRRKHRAIDRQRATDERSARSFLGLSSNPELAPLERSFALARIFASQATMGAAREVVGAPYFDWDQTGLASIQRGPVLISTCASLQSLALIAEARCRGWSLLIEDCPFSRLFIKPLAERGREDLEMVHFSAIADRAQVITSRSPERALLTVVFCYRPRAKAGMEVDALICGLPFELSAVDALLHFSNWERIFTLGSTLRELSPLLSCERESPFVPGKTLIARTLLVASAIEEVLTVRADWFLGTGHLATRCAKFAIQQEASARSMVRSLLMQAQLHGVTIANDAYESFLHRLDTASSRSSTS
jgi:hypothetical protein